MICLSANPPNQTYHCALLNKLLSFPLRDEPVVSLTVQLYVLPVEATSIGEDIAVIWVASD